MRLALDLGPIVDLGGERLEFSEVSARNLEHLDRVLVAQFRAEKLTVSPSISGIIARVG
jgi:hypothetical protein